MFQKVVRKSTDKAMCVYCHLSPDVRQCEPQWKDDGHDDEVGDPFPEGVGPGEAQRLVFILLFLSLRGYCVTLQSLLYSQYLDISHHGNAVYH